MREAREGVGERGVGAAGEDVEVAARFGPSSHAADGGDLGGRRVFLQIGDQGVGHLGRAGQQMTAGESLPLFDRLKNELLFLAAHALDAADAPGLRGSGQIIEALDAQLLVEHGDGLRSDALQPQHVEQRGGEFRQQVTAHRAIAGARDLANASGEVLADAVPAAQRGFIEIGHGFGGMRHDVGGVAIRANLERILALQLEQIGDLEQRARHRLVVEGRAGVVILV